MLGGEELWAFRCFASFCGSTIFRVEDFRVRGLGLRALGL